MSKVMEMKIHQASPPTLRLKPSAGIGKKGKRGQIFKREKERKEKGSKRKGVKKGSKEKRKRKKGVKSLVESFVSNSSPLFHPLLFFWERHLLFQTGGVI